MGGAGAWFTTYLSHRGRFSAGRARRGGGGGDFAAATLSAAARAAERVDAARGWGCSPGRARRRARRDPRALRRAARGDAARRARGAAPPRRGLARHGRRDVGAPGVDWEGGELCSLETDGALARAPLGALGDAAVFVSHKYHCVAPVTRGVRRVLVVEFWHGDERHCGHRCDTRRGPCAFDRHWRMMGERVAAGGDGAASAPREYAAAVAELDAAEAAAAVSRRRRCHRRDPPTKSPPPAGPAPCGLAAPRRRRTKRQGL